MSSLLRTSFHPCQSEGTPQMGSSYLYHYFLLPVCILRTVSPRNIDALQTGGKPEQNKERSSFLQRRRGDPALAHHLRYAPSRGTSLRETYTARVLDSSCRWGAPFFVEQHGVGISVTQGVVVFRTKESPFSPLYFFGFFVSSCRKIGKCLSTIKEDDQFYALDYRKDGSIFAATGKNYTVRRAQKFDSQTTLFSLILHTATDFTGSIECTESIAF